ncbi:hypothetical protein LWI28_018150 [Acer negundo]|uniref:Uncharacterized protein n=1 Tax=Acer negundo TaxID=4023 RepID=A0AAD5JC42_ACENE|nr:hypothetical protein LWI28_018150 [Acer negundo]
MPHKFIRKKAWWVFSGLVGGGWILRVVGGVSRFVLATAAVEVSGFERAGTGGSGLCGGDGVGLVADGGGGLGDRRNRKI